MVEAAAADEVARARAEFGSALPAPLVALWAVADGLTADDGTTVYPAGCLGERNATYEVARYAPGFVLVGDDSGGRGFLLRAGDPGSAVFSSDLGDLDPDGFETEAADFTSWIAALRPGPLPRPARPKNSRIFPVRDR
ncbi:hypothetical protein [Kitasatospora sp. NPDC088134]|uniref:hypothetical protein n=1 Tax=Kitasatospora sp. NPDC088134 TaxID=3364071 RepID=UPI0037F92004